MSIRPARATDDEVAVEPLYQALNEERVVNEFIKAVVRRGVYAGQTRVPVRWRVRSIMGLMAVMLALALFVPDLAAEGVAVGRVGDAGGVRRCGMANCASHVKIMATRALKVATGERNGGCTLMWR